MNVPKEITQFLESLDKNLQKEFAGRISNTKFLTNIMQEIIAGMKGDVQFFFPMASMDDFLVSGISSAPYYDICRMIVGIHRSETFSLPLDEEKAKRKDANYRKDLKDTVFSMIFLKTNALDLYRRRQLIEGEEWLFYPLPYFLYAFITSLLKTLPPMLPNLTYSFAFTYFVNILRKALSALTILDTTLYENAYPICRSMVEEYVKLVILKNNPEAFPFYNNFSNWSFQYNNLGVEPPEEFEELCKKNNANRFRIQFLNYGWVDNIPDYHDYVKDKPYSFWGLYTYCKEKKLVPFDIDILYKLYSQCHSYVHANSRINFENQHIHYIEISLIVYYTTRFYAAELFKEYKLADVDIYAELDKWANKAKSQIENL